MTDRHDLFEDVIAKLRFEPLSRQEQHAQLERIVAAEREACAVLADGFDEWPEIPQYAIAKAIRKRGTP